MDDLIAIGHVFLNLLAWVFAVLATYVVIRRLHMQGCIIMAGSRFPVPVKWPALIALACWLWIIAGCLV